jgi:hypothetical protein
MTRLTLFPSAWVTVIACVMAEDAPVRWDEIMVKKLDKIGF